MKKNMTFVRQIYAGWVGLKSDTMATSGVVLFNLTPERDAQLAPCKPSKEEVEELLAQYKKRHSDDQHGFVKHMNKFLKGV